MYFSLFQKLKPDNFSDFPNRVFAGEESQPGDANATYFR